MKKVIILMLFIFLTTCNPNWGNYGGYRLEYDSALEYYIMLDKGEVIYLSDSKEIQKQKGTVVTLHNELGKIDTIIVGKESIIIDSYVSNDQVAFDGRFILVAQKPLKKLCDCNPTCLSEKHKEENVSTYNLCKDALKNSTYYEYWIIDKSTDAVYGPFSKEKFDHKRLELGVSMSLVLNDKDSFWNRMFK